MVLRKGFSAARASAAAPAAVFCATLIAVLGSLSAHAANSAPANTAPSGNVITLRVAQVALPSQLPGSCRLTGIVDHVWSGQAFAPQQPLSIYVPCGRAVRLMPIAARLTMPVVIHDVDVLRRSRLGIAHVDDNGELIWRPSAGTRSGPGAMTQVSGYQVLDGVLQRATPISFTENIGSPS